MDRNKYLSENYVEVTSLSMSPDKKGNISFSVDLPLGEYDVVASSQGFVPHTGTALLSTPGESVIVNPNPLVIEEYSGSQ